VCVQYVKLVKLDENATHFDKVAAAAHQKFNALAATVVESMVGRKVMAAIVMTSDRISIDSGCVISLATGQRHSLTEIIQLYRIVFIFAQYNTYSTNSLISTRDELDRKALIEHQ